MLGSRKSLLLEFLLFVGAVLAVLGPALWNGYPLLYSDTGTYIGIAFEGRISYSRPPGYGFFIRYSSLHWSLWLTVILQALLMAGISLAVLKRVFPTAGERWLNLAFLSLLSLGTSIGWYTGQVMPDIFTPISFFAFYLLLFDANPTWGKRISLAMVLFLCGLVHYSNAVINFPLGLILVFALVWREGKKEFIRQRLLPFGLAAIAFGMAVLFTMSYNAAQGKGFRFTLASHIFMMAKMTDNGILPDFLAEKCGEKDWKMCAYKDSLDLTADEFLWHDYSPFRKTGHWANSETEYKEILSGIYTSPKFLGRFAVECAKASFLQLHQVEVGTNVLPPYVDGSPPYNHVKRTLPHEEQALASAQQQVKRIDFSFVNWMNFALLGIGIIWIIVAVIRFRREIRAEVWWLGLVLLSGVLCNAVVTGCLAPISNRLQGRVVWLVAFVGLVFAFDLIRKRIKE